MKVYISADIEGVTGVTHWDDATIGKPGYDEAREQMTREVAAACEGALSAGAREIYVKDAHDSGRNLIASKLPREASLIRGWSGHPSLMIQELDESFAALVMIGYHAPAGSGGNPLSHTIILENAEITLNGHPASEFLLHAHAAAAHRVPTALISGDETICDLALRTHPHLKTVATQKGVGDSTISIHPDVAVERIQEEAESALKQRLDKLPVELPKDFELNLRFKEHARAYVAGFYPGATRTSDTEVSFRADNIMDVMRMLFFTTLGPAVSM